MTYHEKYNDSLFLPIRINNIEARWSECNMEFEIVKWFPNVYYQGTKEKFPECDESCFKGPESCFTIAFFDLYDKAEPDVRSVADRVFDLDEEEYNSFKKVGQEMWNRIKDLRSNKLVSYLIEKEKKQEYEIGDIQREQALEHNNLSQ